MNKIQKRVDRLIGLANDLLLKHPKHLVIQACLRNFGILRSELLLPEPNKEKVKSSSYGLIRAYDATSEFHDTPFGEGIEKLLLELQEY